MTLTLRRATAADARRVWEWRNDPAARAASLNGEAIAWEDHARWFPAALETRVILIGEQDGEAVGMVRFDPGDDGWRVSINLAPARRGQGLGEPLLRLAMAQVAGTLLAEVREGNAASERLFAACGFTRERVEDGFIRLRCERP